MVDEPARDHHEALDTLAQIAGDRSNPPERRNLIDTVIGEVVPHSVAEEMYVYPVMRDRFDDGDEIVDHDADEHARRAAPSRRGGGEPPVPPAACACRCGDVADDARAGRQSQAGRPDPPAPNSEVFHTPAGPGFGMIDRMRDRLTGSLHN